MSHLIYGILRAREASRLDPTAGLEGSPVSVITVQGISAVCASVSQCPPTSDLSSILGYAQVVSLLHCKMHHSAGPIRLVFRFRDDARGNARTPGDDFSRGPRRDRGM